MKIKCAHCGKTADKPSSAVNRAASIGAPLFCNRHCSGLGRRKHKTRAQQINEKRLYDAEYRRTNLAMITAKKAAHHKATYDPKAAAIERKKRMPQHIEYCRQPEYKRWKREYDRQHRAKEFGSFSEAYLLTIDLNREIKGRMTNEQIKWQNGTSNKTQLRKRQGSQEKERSRPRGRWRRDRNSTAYGQ